MAVLLWVAFGIVVGLVLGAVGVAAYLARHFFR